MILTMSPASFQAISSVVASSTEVCSIHILFKKDRGNDQNDIEMMRGTK
jgi:hypothetical protein